MSHSGRLRRQREKLFEKNPHCFYCGCTLVMYPLARGEAPPRNYATIDHLRSRSDPRRTEPCHGESRHVLACRACNEALGHAEDAALPLEEKHRRSGRHSPECKCPDKEGNDAGDRHSR